MNLMSMVFFYAGQAEPVPSGVDYGISKDGNAVIIFTNRLWARRYIRKHILSQSEYRISVAIDMDSNYLNVPRVGLKLSRSQVTALNGMAEDLVKLL